MYMSESEKLCITNRRVLSFFQKHPNLNAEDTIVSFVDIMEKLSDSVNSKVNSTLVESILKNMESMNQRMDSIDKNVERFHADTITNFSLRMSEFKKEYIADLRLVLTSNVSDKIEPLLKEQLGVLLERTTGIITTTIPQQNEGLQSSIKSAIDKLALEIQRDSEKLLSSTINASSLENFISRLDTSLSKTVATTQQSITANIDSAEKRLDSRMSLIGESSSGQLSATQSLASHVSVLLQKMENSSLKGKYSENVLVNILHSLYPTAHIQYTGQQKESGDVFLSRPDRPTILIENKFYSSQKKNVPQEEVRKFIRDIEIQKCSGIFLSQRGGIVNKDNFEINIHDGNVLVFMHDVDNDPDKIKVAVNIVDYFKAKLDETTPLQEVDSIPRESLEAINHEVQFLAKTKLNLINLAKEFNAKFLKQLDDIKLTTLEEFLSTRYAGSSGCLTCEFCGYVSRSKAGLAQHKRRCKGKAGETANLVINMNQ